jgi:hypothetical protein
MKPSYTLVYRIDVHARLLILRKNYPLHGLILVCTFIDFEKKLPPARLFHPACLLVLDKENSETIMETLKFRISAFFRASEVI